MGIASTHDDDVSLTRVLGPSLEDLRARRRAEMEDREMGVYGFSTIDGAAAYMSGHMGLDSDDVRAALRDNRAEIGRWEDLHGAEYDRVARLVWAEVTGGAPWPW